MYMIASSCKMYSARNMAPPYRSATSVSGKGTSKVHIPGQAQPPKQRQGQRSGAPVYATPKSVEQSYFILLKDKEVPAKAADSLLSQRHAPSTRKILRGSLLQGYMCGSPPGGGPRFGDKDYSRGRREASRFIVRPLNGEVEFECSSSDIGRISTREMGFLKALSMDSLRLQVYEDKDLILYTLSLTEGSLVKVQYRSDSTSPYEAASAVVRYVGPVPGTDEGTQFGLELVDAKHRGQGTSDGMFRKKRFFQTDPECAIFVPINKLIPNPEPIVYENVQGFKRASQNRPEELTKVGEIQTGMTVHFQVGDTWKIGKVVYMTVPPGQCEPYIAVEMPKTTGGSHQTWDGRFDKQHLYTPREGVYTHFIPANCVIPEHLMEFTESTEKQPDTVTSGPNSSVGGKEKNKGRKSSEPFFLQNNKPPKTPSPYGSSEKLDKGGSKPSGGRRDVSDSYYQASATQANMNEIRRNSSDDLQFSSGHYGEGNKPSFVNVVKGKVDKFRSKFNDGGKDDRPSKANWFTDSHTGKEVVPGAHSEPRSFTGPMYGDTDYLEDDVIEEVTNTIYRDWRTIAHSLYLSNDDIDHIQHKKSTEKERTVKMLEHWQKRGTGYDKISRLAAACRDCGFTDLANELEQGLDESLLIKVASNISQEKSRPFGIFLNFSDSELDKMEQYVPNTVPRIRMMLAKWRTRQSHNSDKIMLLSSALHRCGLRQLELEVARGLDDEIMASFAVQIGHNWKILAITLRLDMKDVRRLEDFSQDKQPYQMLMLWRRRQHRNVDVLSALSKGLRESGLRDLAYELVQGVDDEMIYRLATMIGDLWEYLALHLGFTDEEVKELKQDKYSETNTIMNMLNKWRERHDYTVNRFDFLMRALRACGLEEIAESFERDRQQQLEAAKGTVTAKTEAAKMETRKMEAPIDSAKTKDQFQRDVSRKVLLYVSKHVAFQDLSNVIDIPTEDVIEIENYYSNDDQRAFQLLDCWKRRGTGGRRSYSELLQVIACLEGKKTLMDDIMRMAADEKNEEDQRAKKQPAALDFGFLDEGPGPSDEPLFPDLEVNSMVEVTMADTTKHFGVIRWIGIPEGSKSEKPVAGIELESSLSQGATDGIFNKQRYFQCERNKAIFVYLSRCRPDSRFPSQSQTFQLSKRQTSLDFGGFKSPKVEGFIDPPSTLKPDFVGMQKGIQGDQNSCYLDTTLFSMFAYNSVFDPLLRRTQGKDDLELYEEVQKTLRESIVNPLREHGFVRADRVLELREHLDHLGTTKGLMNEEKDPEEFLHTLLSEVFKSKPLLRIRHGDNQEVDESNIHQIFLDKDQSLSFPTVEQLLLQSFQEHDLKLAENPSCLIVQMPRFGKEYKMYSHILPSLHLDITNIIENYPRQCVVCGSLAVYECRSCRSDEAVAETTPIKNYCAVCFDMMHGHKRSDHKPTELTVPDEFMRDFFAVTMEKGYSEFDVDCHRQTMLTPKLMDLFAVICIRTSHYVAFVKAGRETDSEWVFFDSMADRQGDQQGYNIPQITHLKDFRKWVTKEYIEPRVGTKQLPELMQRLLGDAYICMYSDAAKRNESYV